MDSNLMNKLVKCLELTASEHDGEALNAIRKANNLRMTLKKSWHEILLQSQKSSNYTYYSPPPPPKREKSRFYKNSDEVEIMFKKLHQIHKNRISESAKNFVRSLEQYFADWGNLTERQYSSLEKIYKQFYKD